MCRFFQTQATTIPDAGFCQTDLDESGLMEAYQERPAYQQNDYVGWINRAKRQETKEKRLRQMLEELESRRRLHEDETSVVGSRKGLIISNNKNNGHETVTRRFMAKHDP